MKKRQFLKQAAWISSGVLVGKLSFAATETPHASQEFTLPPLGYPYDALEPYLDARTLEIHYTKHHQTYVNQLNKSLSGTQMANRSLEEICQNISKLSMTIRNNAGGHYNHSMFWSLLKPNVPLNPSAVLYKAIQTEFGSFELFKKEFTTKSLQHFGSGWSWLVVLPDGKLKITTTPNQDNPLMDITPTENKGTPVLALDVWEHAYYLKFQNRRSEYVDAFWNVINWQRVNELYKSAMHK